MNDANGGWNYYQALLALGKTEKYDMAMVEQPVPWWDIDGMARLRRKTRIPVYPDESATELMDLLEIIRKEAADGIFLKVAKAGCLVKSLKFISIAEAAGLRVMCGCMVGVGWKRLFRPTCLQPLIGQGGWDTKISALLSCMI